MKFDQILPTYGLFLMDLMENGKKLREFHVRFCVKFLEKVGISN
jgi:hypothetical protein